jgi:hypothetical protein
MSDTGDEASPFRSGYITPPLSPTKTISTEGWFSPRTPGSPRKARSCLFTREIGIDAESLFSSPPASPTKPKSIFRNGALTIPEGLQAISEPTVFKSDRDSPAKRHTSTLLSQSVLPYRPTRSRTHSFLSSKAEEGPSHEDLDPAPGIGPNTPNVDDWLSTSRKSSYRSVSDSLAASVMFTAFPLSASSQDACTTNAESVLTPNVTNTGEESSLPARLRPFPLRCSSSPLRSSQWMTRGGTLQSPRRGQVCSPDRYIACRRPPAVTRESFEMNKPRKRLETTHSSRGRRADPFSRRLRRSARLNDELHNLRETHSLIVGRTTAQRRNATLVHRRSPSTTSTRQISAGAVWNIGGSSAVSDTVIAVSTGRGGMLGRGTNAPLYTSTFLDRADPEAELEAYEHRLALALDVDQTNRVLQHSPSPFSQHSEKHGGAALHPKHTWRDGAWIKDGVISRLFNGFLNHISSSC